MNDNPFVRLDSRTSPPATRVHDLSSTVARNRFFSTPLVCRWQVKYRGRTKHDSVYHPAVTMVAAWDKKPEIQRTVTHSSGDARHEFRFKPRCVSSSAILARANRPRLGATSSLAVGVSRSHDSAGQVRARERYKDLPRSKGDP